MSTKAADFIAKIWSPSLGRFIHLTIHIPLGFIGIMWWEASDWSFGRLCWTVAFATYVTLLRMLDRSICREAIRMAKGSE